MEAVQPRAVTAWAGPFHVHVSWEPGCEDYAGVYHVYAADGPAGPFVRVAENLQVCTFCEYVAAARASDSEVAARHFYVTAASEVGAESEPSETVAATPTGRAGLDDDEAFLDFMQRGPFEYFRGYADGASGGARESMRPMTGPEGPLLADVHGKNIIAVGGTGFGIAALIVGVVRGFIERSEAVLRLLRILRFLESGDRFHGAWPHWLDAGTGRVVPFSEMDDGADLVETCFVLQSLLIARGFFDGDDAFEENLRDLATRLWESVEFDFFMQDDVLMWHWSPKHAFGMRLPIRGFNECQIAYILGLGHPTHPLPPSVYYTGWMGGDKDRYGASLEQVQCLFWTHYSYIGFHPRSGDVCCPDYFQDVGVRWSQAHLDYALQNPRGHKGYSRGLWGLTASFDKAGYNAHSLANDNGHVSPTAACCAFAYLPESSLEAMRHMYVEYGASLWGPCGFMESVCPNEEYVCPLYGGINQGPVPAMIENGRSGLLWRTFMATEEAQAACRLIADAELIQV